MEEKLKILGFSTNEAKVYLALLKLNEAVVQAISKESGVKRATCYGVIEQLQQKGAITETTLHNTKYYSAVSIDILFEKIKKDFVELEQIIPEIKKIKNLYVNQPKVKFYKGMEGIKNLYTDTLTADSEIVGYVYPQYKLKKLYDFQYKEYIPKRIRKKIYYRGIYVRDEFSFYAKLNSDKQLKEIRLLPKEKLSLNQEINIYNNKIAYVFFKEKNIYGVLIEDHELAKTEKDIFEMLWDYSLKFDQRIPTGFNIENFKKENQLFN